MEDDVRAATILVCPYSQLVSAASAIEQRRFRVCIADESHMLKDYKAQRTKAAQPILRQAQHCFLLTGTPALSRPNELFTQARLGEGWAAISDMTSLAELNCAVAGRRTKTQNN
jgi:SWI/SNF-related matrix-associated actin-dependent regulator 1 of chromatin subfamily A